MANWSLNATKWSWSWYFVIRIEKSWCYYVTFCFSIKLGISGFNLELVEVSSSEHSMCCKNRNRRLLITFVIAKIWKGLKTNNWKGGKTNFRSSILISNFPSFAGITLYLAVTQHIHNFQILILPSSTCKGCFPLCEQFVQLIPPV